MTPKKVIRFAKDLQLIQSFRNRITLPRYTKKVKNNGGEPEVEACTQVEFKAILPSFIFLLGMFLLTYLLTQYITDKRLTQVDALAAQIYQELKYQLKVLF